MTKSKFGNFGNPVKAPPLRGFKSAQEALGIPIGKIKSKAWRENALSAGSTSTKPVKVLKSPTCPKCGEPHPVNINLKDMDTRPYKYWCVCCDHRWKNKPKGFVPWEPDAKSTT